MAGSYILTATNITDTSADILVTDESSVAAEGVEVTMTGGISSVTSDSEGIASFTGLTASTSYTASATNGSVTFTTKATGYNTPRAATQEQWEDLAERVEAASHDIGYSTSEVDTGATWTDGSKIYKKTIDFGALPNDTDKDVAHGISNLGRLIDMNGIISYTSGTNTIFVKAGWTYLDALYFTQVQVRNTDIHVSTSRNMSDRSMVITLYYTKSS